MKIERLISLVPPGIPLKKELHLYAGLLTGSAIFFLLTFTVRFSDAYHRLFWIRGGTKIINPEQDMADFSQLTEYSFAGFAITFLCMLGYIFIHYRYHTQGSMSIYLMKRLPDPKELHRRCLTIPLAAAGITLLTAALLTAVCFYIYIKLTPQECLPPDQLEKFWRGIL